MENKNDILLKNDQVTDEFIYGDLDNKKKIIDVFNYLCKNGSSDLILWMINVFKITTYDKVNGLYLMLLHLHLEAALIFIDYVDYITLDKRMEIIKIIGINNLNGVEIEWIKTLLNISLGGCNIHDNPFYYACYFYDIEIIKIVREHYKHNWDIYKALDLLCSKFKPSYLNADCQIQNINWLISSYDIDFSNFIYFQGSISPDLLTKIFNFSKYDIKLYKAILNSNLDKIKRAIQNGANYDILNDFPFFKSCHIYNSNKYNKTDIIEFFCSIEGKYKVEYYNGFIEFKKTKIEKNTK